LFVLGEVFQESNCLFFESFWVYFCSKLFRQWITIKSLLSSIFIKSRMMSNCHYSHAVRVREITFTIFESGSVIVISIDHFIVDLVIYLSTSFNHKVEEHLFMFCDKFAFQRANFFKDGLAHLELHWLIATGNQVIFCINKVQEVITCHSFYTLKIIFFSR